MHYAFQDKDNIYLLMDYLGGGDLRYHIIKNYKFNETKSSIFIFMNLIKINFCNNHLFYFILFYFIEFIDIIKKKFYLLNL